MSSRSPAAPVFLTTLLLHLLAAGVIAMLLMNRFVAVRPQTTAPESDARTYVRLALAVSEFGVYGMYRDGEHAPQPAMDVMPLYPLFVAALMRADHALRDTLTCVMSRLPQAQCSQAYDSLIRVQTALMAASAVLVWLTAWVWSGRLGVTWAAMVAAFAAAVLPEFAPQFLTENLSLPLAGVFTLGLAMFLRDQRRWLAATLIGIALGLLALTRPSFWYLLLAATALTALLVLLPRSRQRALPLVLSCALAMCFALPWLARNHQVFGQAVMSGGPYGGRSLIQRVTYNDMRDDEFAAAFIYWLPDFGDALAKLLLPATSYRRLGWEEDSFYALGVRRVREALRAGPAHTDVERLVREQVLQRPFAHARATLALAWRGLFIGKSWGLVAWLCAAVILYRGWRVRDYDFALLCLPALFLCLFQAAISVSIPRYNLMLLAPLSIAMAQQVDDYLRHRRSAA